MKRIIDIPEETYEYWKEHTHEYVRAEAIRNSVPFLERERGEWINGRCKCCGEKALYEHYYGTDGMEYCRALSNFCPNCGADLRGKANETK